MVNISKRPRRHTHERMKWTIYSPFSFFQVLLLNIRCQPASESFAQRTLLDASWAHTHTYVLDTSETDSEFLVSLFETYLYISKRGKNILSLNHTNMVGLHAEIFCDFLFQAQVFLLHFFSRNKSTNKKLVFWSENKANYVTFLLFSNEIFKIPYILISLEEGGGRIYFCIITIATINVWTELLSTKKKRKTNTKNFFSRFPLVSLLFY